MARQACASRPARTGPRYARDDTGVAARLQPQRAAREEERIRFILAAYNVGLGHVEDARRLAEKFGDDPGDWDDVAYWLVRKSKRSV